MKEYIQQLPPDKLVSFQNHPYQVREDAALSELMEIIDRRFHPDKLALGGQIARSADLLQLKLPFPWEVSHHLDDAALRGAAYYALRTREECTEVLPKISL